MRITRDAIFDQEARRFGLTFCCEECGLFDAEKQACRHEWPSDEHRRARYQEPGTYILFCKEFELC